MVFHKRLQGLRNEFNLSLSELAVAVGKTEGAVRAWESGRTKPDFDTLIAIAEYFDCTTDYLLGISNTRNALALENTDALLNELGGLVEKLQNKDVLQNLIDIFKLSISLKSTAVTSVLFCLFRTLSKNMARILNFKANNPHVSANAYSSMMQWAASCKGSFFALTDVLGLEMDDLVSQYALDNSKDDEKAQIKNIYDVLHPQLSEDEKIMSKKRIEELRSSIKSGEFYEKLLSGTSSEPDEIREEMMSALTAWANTETEG